VSGALGVIGWMSWPVASKRVCCRFVWDHTAACCPCCCSSVQFTYKNWTQVQKYPHGDHLSLKHNQLF